VKQKIRLRKAFWFGAIGGVAVVGAASLLCLSLGMIQFSGNLMILALASGALWGILIGTGCVLLINQVLDRAGRNNR
jgi:hypothetical protein